VVRGRYLRVMLQGAETGGLTGDTEGENGGPPETRTPDPLIKSQLLYQLS
jgi:hypothetical protein